MKKNKIMFIIIAVIVIALIAVAGYFIIDKVNENRREYSIEKVSEHKYFVVKTNDQYGVINTSGDIVIEPTYDQVEIPNPSKDVFICKKDDKSIALNSSNTQLYTEYNKIEAIQLKNIANDLPYEKSTLICEKNGKYGLIDFDGKKLLDTIYDSIESFSNIEGQLLIQENGKYGVANIKGTILVKPEYDTVASDDYYENEGGVKYLGYIVGNKNEDGYKYGYVDYKGNLKLKTEYNDIYRITDIKENKKAYLVAAKNGQYGVYKNSKNIINNEYQGIEYDNSNDILILQKGSKYGVSNISGDIVIPVENTSVQSKGQYIYVEDNNLKSVYDSNGNKTDIDYDKTIMPTSNDNYKITILSENNSNYYGVVDKNNTELIKSEYLYMEYAFDNYFIACGTDGKLGVLDDKGNVVVELKYDLVQKVQGKNIIQTLAADTNVTQLYSPTMEKICEMENATVENNENSIKISSNTQLSYFNNEGVSISSKEVFESHELFLSVKDGKWGYIDVSGNTKVEYQYEDATEFNDYGFAAVKLNGKWGCINSSGEAVLEPTYEIEGSFGGVEFIGQYLRTQSGYGNIYYTNDIQTNIEE